MSHWFSNKLEEKRARERERFSHIKMGWTFVQNVYFIKMFQNAVFNWNVVSVLSWQMSICNTLIIGFAMKMNFTTNFYRAKYVLMP